MPNQYSHLEAANNALTTDESTRSQNLLSQIDTMGTATTAITVMANTTIAAATAKPASVSPPAPTDANITPSLSGTSNDALYKAVCDNLPDIVHLLCGQDKKWTDIIMKIVADQRAHQAESCAQEEELWKIMAQQKEEV
jgi:hypothetical protein